MRAALLWGLLSLVPLCCPAAATQSAPLTVEDLRCKGNESTSCRFILGYLYLSAGDLINEEEIQNAQLRLSWLRIFESVDIYLEKGSSKGNAIVVVEVKEASPITKVVSLGTEAHLSSVSQVLSANVFDYNLLGTGEILGLQAQERIPIAGPTQRENALRLSYLDPQLFDSKRFFLAAGLTQADLHYESENGDLSEARLFGADVSIGRRIADFSYFTAGFQYRPSVDVLTRFRDANGGFDTTIESSHAVVLLGYGWNSSDPIFPTQGSQLRINLAKGLTDNHYDVAYYFRKTWRWGEDGFWTIIVQNPVNVSLGYEHQTHWLNSFSEVRQARWYVQTGTLQGGYTASGAKIQELELRVGLRLDIKRLGILDLYAYGASDWWTGGVR
jgi:outer membrane protein assembly factor BamA